MGRVAMRPALSLVTVSPCPLVPYLILSRYITTANHTDAVSL